MRSKPKFPKGHRDFKDQVKRTRQTATEAGLLDKLIVEGVEDEQIDPRVREWLKRFRDDGQIETIGGA